MGHSQIQYGQLVVKPDRKGPVSPRRPQLGGKVMEWFSQKTSIAGVQIPNWGIVLGAVVVILLIYSSMH